MLDHQRVIFLDEPTSMESMLHGVWPSKSPRPGFPLDAELLTWAKQIHSKWENEFWMILEHCARGKFDHDLTVLPCHWESWSD